MRSKKLLTAIYVVYLLILCRLIILKYPFDVCFNILKSWEVSQIQNGIRTANFVPFHSIQMYLRYFSKIGGFENLIGNILLFIPVGIFMCLVREGAWRWYQALLGGMLMSLCIETLQLVSRLGEFDVDDILLNTFGVMLGLGLYRLWQNRMRE